MNPPPQAPVAASDAHARWFERAFTRRQLAQSVPRSPSMSLVLVTALCLLVWLRSAVFIGWPGSHFDSDQSVFGLMTNDLLAGRSIPTFAYGRRYMLSVTVWLTAPLFAIFGPSVSALKLPLFAMNLALVLLLWLGLRRERSSALSVFIAVLPFALPGVVATSRLLEHAGGNVEPLLSMVVAYFLRRRPIWLGLWLGIATLNREFAAVGFIALLCLDAFSGELRRTWRSRLLSAAVIGGVFCVVKTLAAHLTRWKGPQPEFGSFHLDNVRGFFERQLPCLLGALPRQLSDYNITSSLRAGHSFVYVAALCWLGIVAWQLRRVRWADLDGFAVYLWLIGGGQAAAFMLFVSSPFDTMLVRYVLSCLLAVSGLVAFAWRKAELRAVTAAFVLIASAANLWDQTQLLGEYLTHTPKREMQRLADALSRANIHYARANYWLAYDLSFITNEHVLVAPIADDRIPRIDRIVLRHSAEVVTLAERSCPVGMRAESRALRWVVCRP
jgi:hypothetical protein